MTYLSAILLGIIQGFTEFLPVSSSGHLIIVQELITNFDSPGIILEVVLHAGTLAAVIFYFRKFILKTNLKYWLLLLYATLPVAIVGLVFREQIELMFENLRVVGFALLATSFFNYRTDRKMGTEKKISKKESLIIGMFQAFAIIPGVSRSGATIFAGNKAGIQKKEAARFSFLLSIPAITGANLLELVTFDQISGISYSRMIVSFLAAFVSGIVAIKYTIHMLETRKFRFFAYYTFIVGILVILFS